MTYADMLPPSGSKIHLTEIPRGSWATAGHEYRVTYAPTRRKGQKVIHAQTDIQLWDEDRDCGTIDRALFWRWAKWEVVAG